MEYGKIIREAAAIALRRRCLWAFGFFAGIGLPQIDHKLVSGRMKAIGQWALENPGLVVLLALLALVFWILQIISQAGLVRGVADIERRNVCDFEACLSSGLERFWRVLGLQIFTIAAALAMMLLLVLPPLALIVMGWGAAKVFGVVWLLAAVLPALAGLVALGLLWNFSLRHCVLEDSRIFSSLAQSFVLVKTNLSESVILFAINFGLGLGLSLAMVLALLSMAIPFIIIGMSDATWGWGLGLAVGLPAFVLAVCLLGVFQSAFWTLGYLRLPATHLQRPAMDPT